MGRFFIFPAVLFFIVPLSIFCQDTEKELYVLELEGSPYVRGYKHGESLKQSINNKLAHWDRFLEEEFQVSADTLRARFFQYTNYEKALKTSCPELLEEIKGIADGSGQDYKLILALHLGEELETLAGSEEISEKCTAISINATDSTPTLLAQNMDPPPWIHGEPLLIIYNNDEGKRSATYSFPGFSGLFGMNAAGIGITCNSISMLNHNTDGLPVFAVVRKVLECNTLKEAEEFIRSVKHATPQCYTIGDSDSAICLECSANSVKRFYPFETATLTFHTNFSIKNRDFSQQFIDLLAHYGKTVEDPYFCPRYFMLYDTIQEYKTHLTKEKIHKILSLREPAQSPINNSDTYGTVIMELMNPPVMHLYPGRPDEVPGKTIVLNE